MVSAYSFAFCFVYTSFLYLILLLSHLVIVFSALDAEADDHAALVVGAGVFIFAAATHIVEIADAISGP